MVKQSDTFRIAVIGTRSSGKSYLLYDLIHAFQILGYAPTSLPLAYPYSSFGSFCFDVMDQGGLRGTELYACRPDNHYGAILSSNNNKHKFISVDFLNIPGEVFGDSNKLDYFVKLKNKIERAKKNIFCLSEWQEPAGQKQKLILPPKFNIENQKEISLDWQSRRHRYMNWGQIWHFLKSNDYKQTKLTNVDGKYVMRHINELFTDSLLLTIKDCWSKLRGYNSDMNLDDYEEKGKVFDFFYPLAYCKMATDIIICDRFLEDDVTVNIMKQLCRFMDATSSGNTNWNWLRGLFRKRNTNVYFAFRECDQFFGNSNSIADFFNINLNDYLPDNIEHRKQFYYMFLQKWIDWMEKNNENNNPFFSSVDNQIRDRIRRCMGDNTGSGFWQLLNYSVAGRKKEMKRIYNLVNSRKPLPPHVFFTATPVDNKYNIYKKDEEDPTRFLSYQQNAIVSFTRQNCIDMRNHLCFGVLQLLEDILFQHNIRFFESKNIPLSNYIQMNLK